MSVRPPRLCAHQNPRICFKSRPPGALTADGVLEIGALGGVVGELDPAEPPESLLPPGRVVPLLPRQGQSAPRQYRHAAPQLPGVQGEPRTFRKKSLRVYACSSQEISSSDSLVPHLPFISAPRDSGISACSVISWKRGTGLRGAASGPPLDAHRPPTAPAEYPRRE